MTGFNTNDYVDVAERIEQFYERFPEGSLKSGSSPQVVTMGDRVFVMYHAQAYRFPGDECPADGWAWEPVPGPTNFTKDSELMNAETAAWGRAIVAAGFKTKKIASSEEVRNRSGGTDGAFTGSRPADRPSPQPVESAPSTFVPPESVTHREQPTDGGSPEAVVVDFGKHKGKQLHEVDRGYLTWLVEKFEPKTASARRIQAAAADLLGRSSGGAPVDDDIPFGPSVV